MADIDSYDIVFVDGPTASGKTTYIATFRASDFFIVSYKALGFANLLATLFLRIFPSRSRRKVFDERRDDPIMRLDKIVLKRFSALCGFSELFYKTFQMAKVAFASIFAKIIVDEGFALRYANYLNLRHGEGVSKRALDRLVTMDLAFLGLLSRRRKVLYLYLDVDNATLESHWRARGHTVRYDYRFKRTVGLAWEFYRPLMVRMHMDTITVAGGSGISRRSEEQVTQTKDGSQS